MKVLIVSDARSVHTQRWLSSLKEKGIDTVFKTYGDLRGVQGGTDDTVFVVGGYFALRGRKDL